MEIIGITGKSGSGKTTLSNNLSSKERIAVIHVDDLLREIKLKYFKSLMKNDKNKEKTKVNPKLKKFLYSNPIIFNAFMKFRAKIIEKRMKKRIQELSINSDIIIIDDIFIKYHKIYKQMKTIILMKRPYIQRKESLKERDEISEEEIAIYDLAYHKKNYKEIVKNKKIIEAQNNGDKERLAEISQEIYDKELASSREKLMKRCNVEINRATITRQKGRSENPTILEEGEMLEKN